MPGEALPSAAGETAGRESESGSLVKDARAGRRARFFGPRMAWIALLGAVALSAGAWQWRLTARGIGVGSDSAVYFSGARNIFEGAGFVWYGGDQLPRPINHYPPLYSFVLAVGMGVGLPPESSARVLNSLLMTGNTFLVGLLAGLLAASWPAALLGGLLFAISEESLILHSWAMSDGLYLFLSLVCVTSATWSLRRPDRRLPRFLMWISAALAFLTRYVGVGLLAVPLVTALSTSREQRTRTRTVLFWAALAALPTIVWMGRNLVLTGSATNRRFGWFSQDRAWWREIGEVFSSWFVPGRLVDWLERAHLPGNLTVLAGLLVLVLLAVALLARADGRATWRIWLPLAAWLAGHLVQIGLSSWMSYPAPDVNTRNLAPAFVAILVLVAGTIGLFGSKGSPLRVTVAVLAGLAFLGFKAYASRDVVQRLLRDGQGYTSTVWSRSPIVATMRDLAPPLVYSNDIGAVYYFVGRYAYNLPLRYDSITGQERADFRAEHCQMRIKLRESGGLVVIFGLAPGLPEAPQLEAIVEGLEPVLAGPAGGIYRDGGYPMPECQSALEVRPDG